MVLTPAVFVAAIVVGALLPFVVMFLLFVHAVRRGH